MTNRDDISNQTGQLRRQAEKQRETLAHKYAAVVATTRDAVLAVNLDGRITVFNPGAEKLFECTAEEALGSPITRFCPEDLLKEQAEMMHRVLDTGAMTGYESERLTDDGRRIPVEITVSRNTNDLGLPSGINAIFRDITERKQMEKTLRRREILLTAFVSALPNISFILDEDGRYIEIFGSQEFLLYASSEKMLGSCLHDILTKEIADEFLGIVKRTIENKEPQIFEYKLDMPAGEI